MINHKTEMLLVLLYAGEEIMANRQKSTSVTGITRLEKLLFLIKETGLLKYTAAQEEFHFVPFHMGPWSNEVYDVVDFLESMGLIRKEAGGEKLPEDIAHDEELFSATVLERYQKTKMSGDEKTEVYILTDIGREKAEQIWARLSKEERSIIIELKKKFNSMNLRQLLRYIYKMYPEYAVDSKIKDFLGLE